MALGVDMGLLLITAVIALRLAVLLALVPVMDNRSVPPLWRLAVAVPLAWALAPAALPHLQQLPASLGWPALALEAINSLLIGALLSFAVNLVLTGVRFGGTLAGMQIGFAIVNAYDPQTGSQISIIAQLYYLLTVLLFFALDVHHHLVATLVASVQVVPPFSAPDFSQAAGLLLRSYSEVFMLGVRVAAPMALVLLLASVAMGVIVKTAPQIHVLVVGFPVKIATGIFVLGTTLVYFGGVVERAFAGSEELLARVLGAL